MDETMKALVARIAAHEIVLEALIGLTLLVPEEQRRRTGETLLRLLGAAVSPAATPDGRPRSAEATAEAVLAGILDRAGERAAALP